MKGARVNTDWILVCEGEEIKFSTKELALYIGRKAIKVDPTIKFIERQRIYAYSAYAVVKSLDLIDKQDYDRTLLLQPNTY